MVPDQISRFKDSTDHNFDRIVGILTSNSEEVLLPSEPTIYSSRADYHAGYSALDLSDYKIRLPEDFARRFEAFFTGPLQSWWKMSRRAEKYDCHWFAFFLKGLIDSSSDTDHSLDIAEKFIAEGTISQRTLGLGEVGVIGLRNLNRASAEHSVVGLGDGSVLQVLGMHDVLAISEESVTTDYYRDISSETYITDSNYGLFVGGEAQA